MKQRAQGLQLADVGELPNPSRSHTRRPWKSGRCHNEDRAPDYFALHLSTLPVRPELPSPRLEPAVAGFTSCGLPAPHESHSSLDVNARQPERR